ncbi:MAG TPA: glycosyltransferase family 39 protein [Verrucomicrobiae bacterium]|nr:glycosyltransferase family 39 protein [Verrucomicrobiae bacterium]
MPRKIPRLLWLAVPLAFLLYFYHIGSTGVLGPDEPRYASIGREMARSGDWITPRLWGKAWFEKPPLLYWMTGAAFLSGVGPDLAPRLPVAILAVGFLAFLWWILTREFNGRVASMAVLILGTSVGWQALGQAGVTDLPLAATFSAAMLLALPWISKGDGRYLPVSAGLMGLAVLAKGPAPLILALPVVLRGRQVRDLLRWRVVIPFLAVALPWYVLCYLRNGDVFFKEFLLKQNVERFTSAQVIQHGYPWWFFAPVLAGGLLPWLPLAAVTAVRTGWSDSRKKFLAAWAIWVLLFFSISANKLPAYILPMLPAAAVLMALALDELPKASWWLAGCALPLVIFPIAAPLLPVAIEFGLSHTAWPRFEAAWLYPLCVAAMAWLADWRGRRLAATAFVAAGVAIGTAGVKEAAVPALREMPSPKVLWLKVAPHADEVCLDHVDRNWAYGLNYYAGRALPECSEHATPWQVRQQKGHAPWLAVPEFSPEMRPAFTRGGNSDGAR